jgi:hypothetical protein
MSTKDMYGILDGALLSTVIGTLSYVEAAGQKVNCEKEKPID